MSFEELSRKFKKHQKLHNSASNVLQSSDTNVSAVSCLQDDEEQHIFMSLGDEPANKLPAVPRLDIDCERNVRSSSPAAMNIFDNASRSSSNKILPIKTKLSVGSVRQQYRDREKLNEKKSKVKHGARIHKLQENLAKQNGNTAALPGSIADDSFGMSSVASAGGMMSSVASAGGMMSSATSSVKSEVVESRTPLVNDDAVLAVDAYSKYCIDSIYQQQVHRKISQRLRSGLPIQVHTYYTRPGVGSKDTSKDEVSLKDAQQCLKAIFMNCRRDSSDDIIPPTFAHPDAYPDHVILCINILPKNSVAQGQL